MKKRKWQKKKSQEESEKNYMRRRVELEDIDIGVLIPTLN